MLTLSLLTVSEKSVDLTLSIGRYSLLFICIMECENSLFFFEVWNIGLFFTFSLSISNPAGNRVTHSGKVEAEKHTIEET